MQHVGVPKSHDPITFTFKPSRAGGVLFLPLRVLASTHLDNKSPLVTNEIGNEAADGNLTTESVSLDILTAQERPELSFGVGSVLPQSAGACDRAHSRYGNPPP